MTDADAVALVRQIADSRDNLCFACGSGNPVGLHIRFEKSDDGVQAAFTPQSVHHGWQHSVHGGILATVLDEAMAYVLFFAGFQGVTARMDIRYRLPVRNGEKLMVEAQMVRDTRTIADVDGRVSRDGQVVAEAAGRFYKVGDISSLINAAAPPETR